MNIFQVGHYFIVWTCAFHALASGFDVISLGTTHDIKVQTAQGLPCSLSQIEYSALHIFYNATNGTHWIYNVFNQTAKWTFPSNLSAPCANNWQGVVCSPIVNGTVGTVADITVSKSCVVTSLGLGTQKLQGTIPPEIGNLRFLVEFDVGTNRLYGTIPMEISNMTSLRDLVLNNNKFSGPLPSAFGSLSLLELLDLNSNGGLNGSIPASWCELKSLKTFTATSNAITGPIPSCRGQWTFLSVLNLEGNLMSGSIPSEVGNWTSLTELYLSSSRFTNTLPTELSRLRSLTNLELQSNLINGTIPLGYCRMQKLNTLYLYSNLLTGTIPDCVLNMLSLEDLNLSNNSLSSLVPVELLSHPALQILELNNNVLTGLLPDNVSISLVSLNINNNLLTSSMPSFGGCIELIYLDVSSNLLTGRIPDTLSTIQIAYFQSNFLSGTLPESLIASTNLQYISIYVNDLTGSIPDVFNSSFRLVEIDFGNNTFSHTIPPSIGQLSRLLYIYLDHNSFDGTFPGSIGACRRLQLLWAEGNSLTGSVPSDIGNITSMVQFSLLYNFITGTLPFELGSLTSLVGLTINNNYITGTLSPFLSNMKSLAIFDLSSNELSGSLLSLFSADNELGNLTTIDFSNNQLTGMLPTSVFRLPSLIVLSLYSNCFTGSVPSAICEATNAQTLALDSLRTGSTCVRHLPYFLSKVIRGVFPIHHLQGTIPECVWSLPYLIDLHLSGNGLRGTLGELPATSKIAQISIAHNRLTGPIPMSMQRYGQFTSFDAVNNKLSGYLLSEFSVNASTSISLSVNRLSGDLPQSIISAGSIDILSGNLFSCPHGELPKSDPVSRNYVCGSDSLNASAYTWMVISSIAVGGIILMFRANRNNCCRSQTSNLKQECHEIDLSRGALFSDVLSQIISLTDQWMKFDVSKHSALLSTGRFLKFMSSANQTFVILVLCYLCGPLVSYCVLKLVPQYASKYSTHSAQYGWVTTASYLHGSVPAALVLVYSFICSLFIACSLLRNGSAPQISFRFNRSDDVQWTETLRRHSIAVGLQLLNAAVLLTVNMGYVTSVILGRYSPSTLLLIQGLMSLFKVAWSSIYIPWAISTMSFLVERHQFRHDVFMNLFNFIIAPCIATFFTDSNCLYYAIVGEDPITSSYEYTSSFNYCLGEVVDVADGVTTYCSETYFTKTVIVFLNPPWFYSYQCGSELLVNYIPVLLYVYAIHGIILPLSKYVMVLMVSSSSSFVPSYLCTRLFGGTILFTSSTPTKDHTEIRGLFRGRTVIVKLIVDFAIFVTFGLAAPILAVAIGFQVFINTILWRLLIGRYLVGIEKLELSARDAAHKRLEAATMPSTKGTVVGMWIVIATCSVFWALLTYDMVGDVYGMIGGEITAVIACVFPTLCFPLFVFYARSVLFRETFRPLSKRIASLQLIQLAHNDWGRNSPTQSASKSHEDEATTKVVTTEIASEASCFNPPRDQFNSGFATENPLHM